MQLQQHRETIEEKKNVAAAVASGASSHQLGAHGPCADAASLIWPVSLDQLRDMRKRSARTSTCMCVYLRGRESERDGSL